MNTYALILNGVVVNIIEASPEFIGTLTGYDEYILVAPGSVRLRDTYSDGVFTTPPPPEEELPSWEEPSNPDGLGPFLTNYAFDMRYTLPERIAIKRLADQRNPDGSYTNTALAVQVNLERAQKAKFVNTQRAETRTGVLQFVALGALTEERALEILDTPIQPYEEYRA